MTTRPLSAALTNNSATELSSLHRTRRGKLDGKIISAVVAIVPDVGLVDSLLRHFFCYISQTTIVSYSLPVNVAKGDPPPDYRCRAGNRV